MTDKSLQEAADELDPVDNLYEANERLRGEVELLQAKTQYLEARLMWNAGEVDRLTAPLRGIANADIEGADYGRWLQGIARSALDGHHV